MFLRSFELGAQRLPGTGQMGLDCADRATKLLRHVDDGQILDVKQGYRCSLPGRQRSDR